MDDLISHRSDDPRALRRHRIHSQASEKLLKTLPTPLSPKKQFDHSPHEVFVQLDELQGNMDEWKETARWIKYEEDVEEGADRWGRPHVAPLSFHSLLNLRLFLEQGVVLLDLEERDFPGVAYKVIEMVRKNLCDIMLAFFTIKSGKLNQTNFKEFLTNSTRIKHTS